MDDTKNLFFPLHCTSVRFRTKQLVFMWTFVCIFYYSMWLRFGHFLFLACILMHFWLSSVLLFVWTKCTLGWRQNLFVIVFFAQTKGNTFLFYIYVFYQIEVVPLIVMSLCCDLICFIPWNIVLKTNSLPYGLNAHAVCCYEVKI